MRRECACTKPENSRVKVSLLRSTRNSAGWRCGSSPRGNCRSRSLPSPECPGFQQRIWSLSVGRRLCWSAPRAFLWVRCGRLLEELRRRLVSRVKVRDQSGTHAIRARQPAVPAVDPVFVVIAQAHEGVVNAEPKREFHRTKTSECAAGVRGWRRLDPRWQSDRWGRRHTNVRVRRRW